ncbi:MAG: hypothetical protein ACR2MS_02280 [Weeksellaceae bacterium]
MLELEMNYIGFDNKNRPYLFKELPSEQEGRQQRREWLMCYWSDDKFLGPAEIWLPGQKGPTYLTPEMHAKLRIFCCNGTGNNYTMVGPGKPEPAHMCYLGGKEVVISPELLVPIRGTLNKAKK